MSRSIIAITLFCWAVPAPAAEAPNSWLADDVALTKATISLLVAKDFAAVRERLDPKIGQVPDERLRQLADMMSPNEPVSIETISATGTHNNQTGDSISRILLEYGLTGRWVVVDAVIKTQASSKRLTNIYLTPNALPLSKLNAFHFFGKGPVQYLFLAGWIAVIALTAFAIIVAFRRHTGWRRWALIVSMPLGLTPTVAVNWNTAQVWVMGAYSNQAGQVIPIFGLRYPMAFFSHTEILVPYLYLSAPLIAFGYLIWHWWRRRQPLASRADHAAQ